MRKLIFFGSDQYSAVVLTSLLKHFPLPKSLIVVTDRKSDPLPVEQLASERNLEIIAYPSLPEVILPDTIGLCASFDHLLSANIIDRFGGNLYNLHPSLLPQYRNVSPVQYALALGDKVTGITLFRISSGIDNGEIIAQSEEKILDADTTPTLTPRLFTTGAELFIQYILNSKKLEKLNELDRHISHPLIFTHRLSRGSGYLEWPILQKLLNNDLPDKNSVKNELLQLRLIHNPTGNILNDLHRALTPWPGVWSIVPTKKGELRITLETITPELTLKIAGKPKPITFTDFTRYYLS